MSTPHPLTVITRVADHIHSITDAMEDKLDPRMKHSFRWRPETAVNRKWEDLQDRFGPEGSNRMMNFGDIAEWTNIQPEIAEAKL